MFVAGTQGTRFELVVVGYQFPAIEHDEWDSNWLTIKVDVLSEAGSWTTTNPSLLTGDIQRLVDWLEGAVEGEDQPAEISFLEPNLCFGLSRGSDDHVTLRVWFELESRPSWAPAKVAGARDLWVDLDVSKEAVREAATDLRKQLARFPPRAAVR